MAGESAYWKRVKWLSKQDLRSAERRSNAEAQSLSQKSQRKSEATAMARQREDHREETASKCGHSVPRASCPCSLYSFDPGTGRDARATKNPPRPLRNLRASAVNHPAVNLPNGPRNGRTLIPRIHIHRGG